MPAAVVGDDVEPFAGEAVDGAGAAAAIVGVAVEIHDGAATFSRGRAVPAAQGDTVALEIPVGARRGNSGGDRALRVEQAAGDNGRRERQGAHHDHGGGECSRESPHVQ